MTYPRKQLINTEQTPFYHCMSRCVRQAFLCGQDPISGKSYEHRRAWVENRILLLADIMCINVLSYAVMNNHTHLVLHIDKEQERNLTNLDVLHRWAKIRRLPEYAYAYLDEVTRSSLSEGELARIQSLAAEYRERLLSISWFMSLLNFYIARKANKEDNCKGRFWEGRFKSIALLDQQAVLSCMSYVDMNPIRAHMSSSLITSHYTSIKRRLMLANYSENGGESGGKPFASSRLLPLNSGLKPNKSCFTSQLLLSEYVKYLAAFQRVDIANDETLIIGHILMGKQWQRQSLTFEREFSYVAGAKTEMRQFRLRMRASGQCSTPDKARLGM